LDIVVEDSHIPVVAVEVFVVVGISLIVSPA
jgi:hypothetical protein